MEQDFLANTTHKNRNINAIPKHNKEHCPLLLVLILSNLKGMWTASTPWIYWLVCKVLQSYGNTRCKHLVMVHWKLSRCDQWHYPQIAHFISKINSDHIQNSHHFCYLDVLCSNMGGFTQTIWNAISEYFRQEVPTLIKGSTIWIEK